MADIKGATARLRKTFHYPDDGNDSDSQPEAMDEQGKTPSPSPTRRTLILPLPLLSPLTAPTDCSVTHSYLPLSCLIEQETLIQRLATDNAARDSQTRRLLLAL